MNRRTSQQAQMFHSCQPRTDEGEQCTGEAIAKYTWVLIYKIWSQVKVTVEVSWIQAPEVKLETGCWTGCLLSGCFFCFACLILRNDPQCRGVKHFLINHHHPFIHLPLMFFFVSPIPESLPCSQNSRTQAFIFTQLFGSQILLPSWQDAWVHLRFPLKHKACKWLSQTNGNNLQTESQNAEFTELRTTLRF